MSQSNAAQDACSTPLKTSGSNSLKEELILAAEDGLADRCKEIIEAGADVDAQSGFQNGMYVACTHNHIEVVRVFLRAGARLDMADEEGFTPLMQACISGNLEIAATLIRAGAKTHPKSTEASRCRTSLHWAAQQASASMCVLLLSAGADPQVKDADGFTPSELAEKMGFEDVSRQINAWIEADRALKAVDAVMGLTSTGAESNSASPILVTLGKKVSKSALSNALIQAAAKSPLDECVKLIAQGADLNHVNFDGVTALGSAATWGRTEVVEALISAGADIDIVSGDGSTPLIDACLQDQTDTALLLIRSGSGLHFSPWQDDGRGRTALHWAASNGNDEVCLALLRAGADPDTWDKERFTAAQVALNADEPRTADLINAFVASLAAAKAVEDLLVAPPARSAATWGKP